jgi:pyruvate dehydrogenase E1 component alpha subunit
VYRTPNVFICVNNQYAISTPVRRQTAAETIAQKASAYGFEGVRADGNDVLAMLVLTRKALEKARSGGGPRLIEAFTYRMGNHTTSDDATRYRQEAELKEWARRDPIERFRLYLKDKGLWDEAFENQVQKDADDLINKAVEEAETTPLPRPEDLFAYTYKDMTPELRDQLAEIRAFLKREQR